MSFGNTQQPPDVDRDLHLEAKKKKMLEEISSLGKTIELAEEQVRKIEDKTEEIEKLDSEINEKQELISSLDDSISQKKKIDDDFRKKEEHLAVQDDIIKNNEALIIKQGESLAKAERETEAEIGKKKIIQDSITDLQKEQENIINETEEKKKLKDASIKSHEQVVFKHNGEITALEQKKKELNGEISALEVIIDGKNVDISNANNEVVKAERNKEKVVEEINVILKLLEEKKESHKKDIVAREEEMVKRESDSSIKEAYLNDKEQKLRSYKTQLEEFYGKTFDNLII